MCSVELKDKIYESFEKGLKPNEVIVKFNIPHEKRVVSGCYTYYKMKKKEENEKVLLETVEKDKLEMKQLMDSQVETLKEIYSNIRKLAELNKQCNMSRLIEKNALYGHLQQIVLHKIEADNETGNEIKQLKEIRNARRVYKSLNALNDDINATRYVHKLNETMTILNQILISHNKRNSGDENTFSENRKYMYQKNDEYMAMINEVLSM